MVALTTTPPSQAAVVFDNMSNFENGVAGTGITATSSTPNTFMGDGYVLPAGTTSITGFDIFPVNLSGTSFTGLEITIYVWQNVNTGTVNSSTPAFSNLLAVYTLTASGTFDSGYYFPVEGSPVGSSPGVVLATPLAITGTNIGITINYQGTVDGVNYANVNNLTSLIAYGTLPVTGGQDFNGYFRNASSETDGNFISSLRSLGLADQSLALRIFGTVPGGNQPPLANSQAISLGKNTSASITLTGTDPDGDPLTYTLTTNPTNGVLSGTAPNLTYTPNANFVGTDAFTFTASDGQTDSAPAVISLSVLNSAGLVINPIWDSTILSDSNVGTITNTINSAILIYESKFANPVTVNITFAEMTSGLGQSQTYIGNISYANFFTALAAHAKTSNDFTALAHITSGPNNPVNGGANITLTTANLRALGFSANPPGGSDSTISLNMSLINLTRPPANPNHYDLMAVASHEIDEVLGTSSGVGQANISPPDLWRYSSTAGTRNFSTSGDDAYFALDGTNDLARYNNDGNGDYGDWWSAGSHSPVRVQDAYGTPGATPDLGVELTVLDVIGWDLVTTTPAPNFQSVTLTNGTITFTWASASGQNYQVQYLTNLNSTAWTSLGSAITASGPTESATDSVTSDQNRFYRVALLSTPGSTPVVSPFQTFTIPLTATTKSFLPQPLPPQPLIEVDQPAIPAAGSSPMNITKALRLNPTASQQ